MKKQSSYILTAVLIFALVLSAYFAGQRQTRLAGEGPIEYFDTYQRWLSVHAVRTAKKSDLVSIDRLSNRKDGQRPEDFLSASINQKLRPQLKEEFVLLYEYGKEKPFVTLSIHSGILTGVDWDAEQK